MSSDPQALAAARLLESLDRTTPLDPQTLPAPLTVDAAQALQMRVCALREARGERRVGYKIGFTNRSIWPIYGVDRPIWAPVWDSTLTLLDGTLAEIAVRRFSQPRLEPEIVFGLASTPASADPDAVFDAIDWVAHGFEIVQCPYPDWKFDAALSIAAQSLHGALIVGPRRQKSIVAGWQALASIRLSLFRNDERIAEGEGRQVLDNPVLALGHLVRELARSGLALQPGDVVTTGTLTDAQPLGVGQRWATRIEGADLPGLVLLTR